MIGAHFLRRTIAIAACWLCFSLQAQVNVLTYHNNLRRTGENLNETILTPSNVNATNFGKLFVHDVDGYVFAQPLYISGIQLAGQGMRNVVFVATEHNSVYAFDADSNSGPTAGLLWHVNLGPSAAVPNDDFGNRYGGFSEIQPEVGITGTPLIDPATGTLFVDAFTHEGTNYYHRLHALNITNGVEQPFSPVLVGAAISGIGVGGTNGIVTFDAKQQLQRSALTLAGGVLYVAYAGYADTDPYHGWIIGFNSSNLQPLTNYVFNTTPNSTIADFGTNAGEAGIWMSGGGLAVDSATNLYFAIGNGSFNAFTNSGTEYGDSLVKLSTTNGLAVADYFTPYDQQFLADNDLDFGSSGVTLLPDQPSPFPHLLVCGGKEGTLYLVNRDRMTTDNSHYNNGGSEDLVVQTLSFTHGAFGTPAWFNGRMYFAPTSDNLKGFSMTNGMFDLDDVLISSRTYRYPGATPSISANGTTDAIVWAVRNGTPAILTAYNATNFTAEIYNSSEAANARDQLPDGVKFVVPTVANGKVYVGGQYALSVFGLLNTNDLYTNWKSDHFGGEVSNPDVSGDQANPDGDSICNLLEFAFASDPNIAQTNGLLSGAVVTSHFQLQFKRNTAATNLTYIAQATDALDGSWITLATYTNGTWMTNTVGVMISESAPTGSPPDQSVNVTIIDPTDSTASGQFGRYFRINVSRYDRSAADRFTAWKVSAL